MSLLANAWQDLKQLIAAGRNDPQKRDALMPASEAYFQLTDDAVSAAESSGAGKVASLKRVQVGLLLANLCGCLGIAAFVQWRITRPLRAVVSQLTTAAETAAADMGRMTAAMSDIQSASENISKILKF